MESHGCVPLYTKSNVYHLVVADVFVWQVHSGGDTRSAAAFRSPSTSVHLFFKLWASSIRINAYTVKLPRWCTRGHTSAEFITPPDGHIFGFTLVCVPLTPHHTLKTSELEPLKRTRPEADSGCPPMLQPSTVRWIAQGPSCPFKIKQANLFWRTSSLVYILYLCVCMCVYIYTYIYIYIYIHMYIHTVYHTCIHIYLHTPLQIYTYWAQILAIAREARFWLPGYGFPVTSMFRFIWSKHGICCFTVYSDHYLVLKLWWSYLSHLRLRLNNQGILNQRPRLSLCQSGPRPRYVPPP